MPRTPEKERESSHDVSLELNMSYEKAQKMILYTPLHLPSSQRRNVAPTSAQTWLKTSSTAPINSRPATRIYLSVTPV